jgi:hypothetical protein
MPWQALDMRTRFGILAVAVLLLPTGCSDDEPTDAPTAVATSDADCVTSIPDEVFATLGWAPTVDGATSTVRGCRRQASQGYVEVRRRTASYDQVCATLDRTGTVGPGVPAPWLGADVKACAVEPDATGGQNVGQTKVVVPDGKGQVLQIFVAALTDTPQGKVRKAIKQLLAANPKS